VEVHDESMLPTLRPGDRLLVDRRAYRRQAPCVGDIVVVVDPTERSRWLVKRVLVVGPAALRYATGASFPVPAGEEAGPTQREREGAPIEVRAGAVWVQGDAGDGSRDSRRFGPIPAGDLVGRVYRCYAPPDRRRPL
jgi:signal peptidase I